MQTHTRAQAARGSQTNRLVGHWVFNYSTVEDAVLILRGLQTSSVGTNPHKSHAHWRKSPSCSSRCWKTCCESGEILAQALQKSELEVLEKFPQSLQMIGKECAWQNWLEGFPHKMSELLLPAVVIYCSHGMCISPRHLPTEKGAKGGNTLL